MEITRTEVHRWTPCHGDPSRRKYVDRPIVLVKINDTSVPVVEGGVMDAGKPEHMQFMTFYKMNNTVLNFQVMTFINFLVFQEQLESGIVSIPSEIVSADSLNSFKNNMRTNL